MLVYVVTKDRGVLVYVCVTLSTVSSMFALLDAGSHASYPHGIGKLRHIIIMLRVHEVALPSEIRLHPSFRGDVPQAPRHINASFPQTAPVAQLTAATPVLIK